jgi:Tfp pilus assembly PilM family ATPase/Tfp pilus assembly protein PilN
MYGKFVGLDIGSKDIKISLIKRGLRDVQLLQTIRTEISSSPEGDSDSLSEVFKAYSLPKGDIAASIVQNPTSIRVVNFPFSDPKKIDQVYEYELENLATFDPREKIHGYHLVKNGAGSEALVCVSEKNHVSELIGSFNEHGIDPKIITYTPLAFSALNEFLSSERPLLLIDLGDSEISYMLFDENGIRRVRSSTKSVEMFLNKLSRITELNYNQDFSQLDIGNQDGSNLEECFAPILSEIKKTVQFFELEVKVKIKTIEISGSLSLIRGIGDFLKDTLNKDVKKIYIPDLGADKSPLYAKSYALALYGSSFKNGYLNFRKNEFKYSGVDNEFRKVLMVPGILLGILILFLIYTSASSYYELKNNVDNIEAQIAQVVKDTFPEVKVIPKPILYMQSEVGKVREKLDLIEGVQGGQTPLDALRDISSSLPESLQLTVNDIKFESADKIKIQGVCGSYQEVAEIEEALEKSGMFETVTRNQTGNAKDGKTKFEISVVLKSKA